MRFHRGTLSVDGLNPWAMTVIFPATEWGKKTPSVWLTQWMLLLSASDCQSVTDWNAEESAPAAHWPSTSLYHPSLNISIHPPKVSNVCLFTFTEYLPPPLSTLVATETADSGRVGGCLRALAALPHAVLSQYISASVLPWWSWYADSSGGWVTNFPTTQRLFIYLKEYLQYFHLHCHSCSDICSKHMKPIYNLLTNHCCFYWFPCVSTYLSHDWSNN